MRLLDTETGQFVEKDPEDEKTVYAILSHTWDEDGEQTYEQLKKIQQRYHPASRNLQTNSTIAETGAGAVPKLVGALPPALGRLTESEVEALLRLVAQTFGLTPAPTGTPSPSDSSVVFQNPHISTTSSPPSIWDDPELSPKIRDACRVARENGFRYIWIDSCCIDKSSSSELSEALNSMYRWYSLAVVCYAYLSDVPPGENHCAEDSPFRKSRWFCRGWTLQELIAPVTVEFLSQDWAPIGSKHTLVDLVESITKIDGKALWHVAPLAAFSVAQRLSWAADRETTRVEDRAYSLLGIFDINMPTLYGEGDRAFQRLQEQIMQHIPDQSLFAWGDLYIPVPLAESKLPLDDSIPDNKPITLTAMTLKDRSHSAQSPGDFKDSGDIRRIQLPASHYHEIVYTLTSYGIRTQLQMVPLTRNLLSAALSLSEVELELPTADSRRWYLAILGCEHREQRRHLLGRVCSTLPSESGVDLVYSGCIDFDKTKAGVPMPDLFLLSLDTIERCRPDTELKTVYIPHPDGADNLLWSHRRQPYTTIKLVLLTETCDALRSRGYEADLRHPDPDHPAMHQLTLSSSRNDAEPIIVVEFRHRLDFDGKWFTIEAEAKMLGGSDRVPLAQVRSSPVPDSAQAERHVVSWSDSCTWFTQLDHRRVQLSTAEAGTITVDMGLDFVGAGAYFLRVDVLREEQRASSESVAVQPAGDQAAGEERQDVEDSPEPQAVDTEKACLEEEGEGVMASVEARDMVPACESTADRGGDSASA